MNAIIITLEDPKHQKEKVELGVMLNSDEAEDDLLALISLLDSVINEMNAEGYIVTSIVHTVE